MKIKKGILFVAVLLIATSIISVFSQVKAATGSLMLNLKLLRNSGYGYKLGNSNKNIWKIYETGGNVDDTIYCLKGGPGFGSSDFASGNPVETQYTRYFNLKDASNIPATYQNALPSINSQNYKALMWILENCYVAPKKNASTEIINQANIDKQNLLNAAANYADSIGNPDISGYEFDLLTDDDIDVTQQLAIWYYTNSDTNYHVDTFEFYLNAIKDIDANYKALSDDTYFANAWERAIACQALFDYLVKTPQSTGFYFDYTLTNITTSPIEIVNTNPVIEESSGKYIVGPLKIQELNDINYSLDVVFKDGNNTNITNVTLLNSSKQPVTSGTTVQDLIGQNFYISVPNTVNVNSVTLAITGSYRLTTTTYWSVENPTVNDQPVVKVERENKNFSDSIVVTYEEPEDKYFDLALRKFITSINGVAPTNSRVPVISNSELTKLANGTTTTANKVHPKNTLEVKTGDKVIYKIRVYNEGEIDGYATEVTDYLPTGLKFLPTSTINQAYGWTNPSGDGKTIKTSYLQNKLISAFDGTNLDYEDLEIECEVIATIKEEDQNLKNIAEITAHKDKDGNTNIEDRDSEPNNVNRNNYGETSQQDDDDFENLVIKGKYFDLSLRKFISKINETTYNRVPQVVVSSLLNGTSTTATYNHSKEPISVYNNDIVTYTIRVYNEGELDGYVTEITDHLPKELEFIQDDELNIKYGWVVSSDGRTVTTDITSPNTVNSANRDVIYAVRTSTSDKVLLKAFNGTGLDYIDVQIRCRVKVNRTLEQKITNIADITGFTDSDGNTITDRDSQKNNVTLPTDETLPNYKDTEIEREDAYIPGQQDDDDFEKLVSVKQEFDLALRKFIISVNGVAPTVDRTPVIDDQELAKLKNGTKPTAKKVHTKDALTVKTGDKVIYKIRVYNEGDIDGYATEVTDYLPTGLKFLPDSTINQAYGWTNPSGDGKTIKTSHLQNKLISAFDGTTLDYEDLEIECEVIATIQEENQNLKNIAEITAHKDKDGNTDITDLDRDSQPDNLDKENYEDRSQEDDDDFENLVMLGQYFDLSLRKFISKVNDVAYNRAPQVVVSPLLNGTSTTATYNHSKEPISVYNKDIVTYTIRVYNEGQIDGYVTEITDHLPKQLEFIQDDELNIEYGWKVSSDGRTVTTDITSPNTANFANRDVIYAGRTSTSDKVLLKTFNGAGLDYIDVQIRCRVKVNASLEEKITNIADITGFTDSEGNAITDRDSQEDNVSIPSDKDLPDYKDTEIKRGDEYIPGQQDDDDFEKLISVKQYFDLSLRKFITNIANSEGTKKYNRAPEVDVTKLKDKTSTTAIYNHDKTPISVNNKDVVTYTIRVYNEGEIDGYVTEITDHLPSQLEFIVDDELNAKYGWKVSTDGRTVTTDITSKNTANSASRDEIYAKRENGILLKAFDGIELDYIDVQINCKVKEDINLFEKITNIADITGFTDGEGNVIEDRDSQEGNVNVPSDKDLPNYKDTEIERGDEYIPGQQDDDDFEKLILQKFDLALRKFITGVNDKEITSRAPVFNITDEGKYVYTHTKEPVEVANSNIVIYTLRIFNEGNMNGYATEVKDDLPDGLEFLPENVINTAFKWKMYKEDGTETKEISEAKTIRTDFLSKENEKEDGENLIKAFDPETMTMPDYKDLKIAFKVTEPNTSDRIIINIAEIANDSDEDDNPIDDIDSEPDNDEDGEDDIDIEKIKVKYFDLSLRKWVTESIVTYNGKTTVTKTGHKAEDEPETPAKVEIRGSRISKTTVKFKFKIRVTNEGEIEGYAKEIIDYIPQGLKFVAKDNPNWREEEGKVLTNQLKDTLLKPGESAEVEIILTWNNNKNNMGLKTNWAEIYEDYNEYDSPDIDSTPGNDIKDEDDEDYAPVILAVVTGSMPTYFTLAIIAVGMIAVAVILIKKFVI